MPALQRHCDDGQQMSSQLRVPTPSGRSKIAGVNSTLDFTEKHRVEA
jgi:hypothetical protein